MTKARDLANIISGGFTESDIPNLSASKITSGTLDNARITLDANEIPNISTDKLTSGTIPDARLPATALNSNVSVQNQSAFKNIIINGDMSIAQRGTSVTGVGASDTYLIDRFLLDANAAPSARFTMSQSTDVPTGQGFATSLKMDCTTAQASYTGNQLTAISQRFEGQNVQYLKYGTSSAETLTLSFWVKSNKTGTYIAELDQAGNSKDQSQSYTISSANTWEKKTLTYTGDTASTLANDNTEELEVYFWLACSSAFSSGTLNTSWNSTTNANRAVGQVNLSDSTSNDFYITGIQLEAGTTASDFEFLPVDVNLARCQRYFYMHAQGAGDELGIGCYYNSSQIALDFAFPVTMRATPSVYQTTGTDYFATYRPGVADGFNSLTAGSATTTMFGLYNNTEVSGTAQDAQFFRTANGSTKLGADAEL